MKGKLSNPNFILEEIPEDQRSQNLSQNEDEDDALDVDDGILFTKRMRIETRRIHNISDTLVNAKLGLAMSDDKIWAEGLLIFYEIFKFLEAAMLRLSPKNELFKRMHSVIIGVERTAAFEQDLEFYYSSGYLQTYKIRPCVSEYVNHLTTLEQREPLRLLAYIYHLYMGLLSGGQILKKKREFRNRFKRKIGGFMQWCGLVTAASPSVSRSPQRSTPGDAITTFGDGRSIADIKKEIAFTMNDIASDLSRDEKNSLLEESLSVFRRNNEIVGSIQRTGMAALAALRNYATCLILVISIGTAVYLYWSSQ